MKQRVFMAMPYNLKIFQSHHGFSGMFIRQFNFPNFFDSDLDQYESFDNDVLREKDCEKHNSCFDKHTGSGELRFGEWVKKSSDETIIDFLKDMLSVDLGVDWTGYRILVSRDSSNGYQVWFLEIFSKHPNSSTKVYTGEKAPNVQAG